MTTGGLSSVPFAAAPDSRTRSIWLTQLVLAAGVVIISVLVLALAPPLFLEVSFAAGVLGILALTVVTLAAPWSRLSKASVLAIPFLDALSIGSITLGTSLRFGFLWVFPVVWVAMHFRATVLAVLLGGIGVIVLIDAAMSLNELAVLPALIVMLSLTFIGITAHLTMRQMHAFRRLLSRQARRLNATLTRRSDQERRVREMLNRIDIGVVRIAHGGTVLAVNDAYIRLYGLNPLDPSQPARSVEYDELRGMPVPLAERPFARAARGAVFTDVRVWLFTMEGEWRALSVTAKPEGSWGNEDASVLLLVHDVTAITHAQRERERLTAIASHELKHPLTVMIGNAELALEGDDLTPRTRQRLETIVRASERMLEMATSMLKGSHSAAPAEDSLGRVDLRQVVTDSIDSFRPAAIAHEVSVELRMSGPLPATADGFRIRQVVDNLVSNAIKYTPRDGEVRITGALEGDEVVLTVADTGIGISSADMPHILTPYFRTDKAKETASGTGLGLSISRDIVTAHKGTLTIRSEAQEGTTVTVRLPRAPARRTTEPAREPA